MFELRQACRGLLRRPAYTAACIGTLALVIGVNAALFAAINATIFRPIPLKSADRTVQLYTLPPGPTGPILGRILTDEEETQKAAVVVLSHGAWQRRFGGDRAIVGRTIHLDGEPFTVIGVMPANFPPQFLTADLFTPLGIAKSAADNGRTYLVTIAQIADGATFAQAEAEITDLFRGLVRELPK